jgi:hypothetical protein
MARSGSLCSASSPLHAAAILLTSSGGTKLWMQVRATLDYRDMTTSEMPVFAAVWYAQESGV